MNPNEQPVILPPQNSGTQALFPQQNTGTIIPRQTTNQGMESFFPQPIENTGTQPFFVPLTIPYPVIPDNTPVDPALSSLVINLPPAQSPYQVIEPWLLVFENWAYQNGINGGYVSRFTIQALNGPLLNVYYNAMGQLEAVLPGKKPQGY